METTIHMQSNFITGFLPLTLLFIFIAWPVISKVFGRKRKKEKTTVKPLPLPIKNNYINKIESIASLYDRKTITSKQGFQELSFVVRSFVLEYAGIDVTKKTLAEIRSMNIKKVEKMVELCYEPEFSNDGCGDLYKAIYEAKKIIDSWN